MAVVRRSQFKILTMRSRTKPDEKDRIDNPLQEGLFDLIRTHPNNSKHLLALRAPCPDAFARFMESNDGGQFLAQLIYWTPRATRRDGYVYKSVREWCEELFITEYQVEKYRKFLKDKGILELKKLLANGRPTWHYRVNKPVLQAQLSGFLDQVYAFQKDEPVDFVPDPTHKTPEIRSIDSRSQEMNNNVPLQGTSQRTTEERDTGSSAETGDDFGMNETGFETKRAAELSRPIRDTGGHVKDALRSVEVFESVGVTSFDVTFKNDETGGGHDLKDFDFRKQGTHAGRSMTALDRALQKNETENVSFIVRPRGARLIQVDDLDEAAMLRLKPHAFFIEETSANNFQAWLAFRDDISADQLKSIRKRLLAGTGGDTGASGSTRWVGAINLKPDRNRFRVKLISAAAGWFTNPVALEDAGLLAQAIARVAPATTRRGFKAKVPDYQRCLEQKGYDRSQADASFLAICKARGFSRDEAIDNLWAFSEKADECGELYVERTADFVYE